jgi:hypothetical protein
MFRVSSALRSAGVVLALTALWGACRAAPPTEASSEKPQLDKMLESLAAEASRNGQLESAESMRLGAMALRYGVTPSEIEVKLRNQTVVYQAIVVGVRRTGEDGQTTLARTLIAWTGMGTPNAALLRVSSLSEFGLFGRRENEHRPGEAYGTWLDLVRRERWIATAGSAQIVLAGTGGPCPVPSVIPPGPRCVLATYDIRINGVFHLDGSPSGAPLPIHTKADGVNGVVLSPAD